MPWSNNGGGGPRSSGPWGGGNGGGGRNGGGGGPWGGGNKGGGPGGGSGGGQGPKIDDFFKKGQGQLKSVFGDGGGFGVLIVLLIAAAAWIYVSVFTVEQNERAVILTFGEFSEEVGPGLNFAPWPVQRAEIRAVTTENTISIGGGATRVRSSRDGVMLTGDENIIDVTFQVVWVIDDLQKFLFNLADPNETIEAVSVASMREIVGQSELLPLLSRARTTLASEVRDRIQQTLDGYDSGVRIVRVNLAEADVPSEVRDDFRSVQAAEQQRETALKQAEEYYSVTTAGARGLAAEIRENAEGYYAQQVADAEARTARFSAMLVQYRNAPEVTRRRLYIESIKRILQGANKIFIDSNEGGAGILPYLPLDRFTQSRPAQ